MHMLMHMHQNESNKNVANPNLYIESPYTMSLKKPNRRRPTIALTVNPVAQINAKHLASKLGESLSGMTERLWREEISREKLRQKRKGSKALVPFESQPHQKTL